MTNGIAGDIILSEGRNRQGVTTMPLTIIHGDITHYEADAIVMPASQRPVIGRGLDRKIYHLAGRNRLLAARRKIGYISIGDAAVTDSFDYHKTKYIVHTVTPPYENGKAGEDYLLYSCYQKSLMTAEETDCRSVLFPVLSSGIMGYPVSKALAIGCLSCTEYLDDHDMSVMIVVYDSSEAHRLSEEVSSFMIDNSYAGFDDLSYSEIKKKSAGFPMDSEIKQAAGIMDRQLNRMHYDKMRLEEFEKMISNKFSGPSDEMSLDEYIGQIPGNNVFSDFLNYHMAVRNIESDAELARKSMMSPDIISRLRTGTIHAKRDYLWQLALVLQLTLDETERMFNICGNSIYECYRFSLPEMQRERVIEYFIKYEKWDIDEVNTQLCDRGFKLLGRLK